VVLLGAGHTHLHVIRHWSSRADSPARLTCISQFPTAVYSGLLPAVLAGQQPAAAMEVPLPPLCRGSGATLIVDDVAGICVPDRCVQLSDGRTVPFDLLSVGVGSVPRFDGVRVSDDAPVISIKPMQTFLARLRDACARIAPARRPIRVVTVGGGAGGVEVALCLPRFVEASADGGAQLDRTLVTAGPLVVGGGSGLARRVGRALARAGVRAVLDARVVAVHADRVELEDGGSLAADLVLWSTGAAAAPVLRTIDLPKDALGFLQTTATLQSPADPAVFAVGDAGTIMATPTAKAGVHAVRQGPVLLENLRRAIGGAAPREHAPQRYFLKLLNTGDGRAIGEWRGLSFEGAWCLRWKNHIDLAFVSQYRSPG
jgi:pyridine nucleotide-disulfide oxidoreductase family protein